MEDDDYWRSEKLRRVGEKYCNCDLDINSYGYSNAHSFIRMRRTTYKNSHKEEMRIQINVLFIAGDKLRAAVDRCQTIRTARTTQGC